MMGSYQMARTHRPSSKALIISALVVGTPSYTMALSGTDLYRICLESRKGSNSADLSCRFYIRGLIDGMIMGVAAEGNGVKVCFPDDGLDLDQGRLIIEKYLRDHPEQLNKEAGLLSGSALIDAFPCKP
jgi:hypothetical protein